MIDFSYLWLAIFPAERVFRKISPFSLGGLRNERSNIPRFKIYSYKMRKYFFNIFNVYENWTVMKKSNFCSFKKSVDLTA